MPTRLLVATTLFLLTLSSRAEAQTPALEVENSGGATLFQVNTDGSIRLVPQGAAAGLVLTATDATGNAAWQAGTGLALPFTGTYNQIPPAFSLTKNAGGDVMSLSSTVGGRVLFGSMTGGVPGSMAMRVFSGHGGLQMDAGNGWGINAVNSSANATLRAVNNGSGPAGRFEGDVEVTGVLNPFGLTCTGCVGGNDVQDNTITGIDIGDGTVGSIDIANGSLTGADIQDGSLTAADVDASAGSGLYVSKGQLYIEDLIGSVPAHGILTMDVACRDANDLPLAGSCETPGGQPVFAVSTRMVDWTSITEAASYECTFRSETGVPLSVEIAIVCIEVN